MKEQHDQPDSRDKPLVIKIALPGGTHIDIEVMKEDAGEVLANIQRIANQAGCRVEATVNLDKVKEKLQELPQFMRDDIRRELIELGKLNTEDIPGFLRQTDMN